MFGALRKFPVLSRIFAVMLAIFTVATPYSNMAFASQADDTYTVTLKDSANGILSFEGGDGNTLEFNEGEEVVINVEADAGFTFEGISVSLAETGEEVASSTEEGAEQFSFTMPAADVAVEAQFMESAAEGYGTVVYSSTAGGSVVVAYDSTDDSYDARLSYETISGAGGEYSVEYPDGRCFSVIAEADSGYKVESLTVTGKSGDVLDSWSDGDEGDAIVTVFPDSGDVITVDAVFAESGYTAPIILYGVGDATTVYTRTGEYASYGGYSTAIAYTDTCDYAYCAWPSKGTPDEGTYTKDYDVASCLEYTSVSGAEKQIEVLRMLLYYGYGGPGFDSVGKSYFPSTWYDGTAMTGARYYALMHIMIADQYSYDLDFTLYSCEVTEFVNYAIQDVIGYDEDTHTFYDDATLNAMYSDLYGTVPDGFVIYVLHGSKSGASAQDIIAWEYTPEGYVAVQKSSGNSDITSGNSYYSLAGAVYGVYSDSGCSTQVATLTTASDGSTDEVELDEGTYYVKEITASSGYDLDTTIYTATVSSGETTTVNSTEPPKTAYVNLMKLSGNTDITDDNTCYSLAGAVYGVYSDSSCTDLEGKLTTDEDGNTDALEIPLGVHYVKEISASTGYALDEAVYTITATEGGKTYTVTSTEQPTNDPAGVTMYKIDQETGGFTALGGASLAGAQFTVTHYAGYYTEDEIAAGKPEEDGVQVRTWVIETIEEDGEYIAYLQDTCLVSGDDWYYNSDGLTCLPLGTITIEETKAPTGYLLDGGYITYTDSDGNTVTLDGTYYYSQIYQDDEVAYLDGGNEYTQSDIVKRGDFEFTKKNDSYENMANVKFSITSNTTGESHIIWTDENGYYSTSSDYILHSYNTNSDEPECGIWFGLNEDGTNTEVDDERGALPYDTYTVQELECDANAGMSLRTFTVTISRDGFQVDMGTIIDSSVVIETTATDSETGSHLAVADGDVTIEDSVYYELAESGTYTLKGILMDKSTGAALLDEDGNEITAELTFTAGALRGTKVMDYTFDASSMAGTSVVVFEYLYNEDDELIAEHTDIDDEDQTVVFPELGTTALDSETADHLSNADEDITIVDTIAYSGLESLAGKKVTVTGTLMDKSTGEALLDDDGNEITATDTFTVDESGEGTYDLTFTFSGSCLEGTTAVAFESISYKDCTVATHMDIDDEDQTVYFPKVRTKAEDLDTGTNTSMAGEETTIVDHVYVYNLIPGKEYTITGILMDQSTGEVLLDADGNEVASSVTFTATSANGTVDMEFTFDSSLLAGTTVVVFEDLYYDGVLVGTHSDLTDEAQAITFPGIGTTATDASDGDKYITATKDVTIDDLIEYTGLAPDVEHKMVLTVMDKSTGQALLVDGEEVTAELEFVPEDTDGSVTVSVTFDASALSDGTELVMFEKAYMKDNDGNWVEVANHEDLDDEGQTVTVTKTTKSGVSTGDNRIPLACVGAGCAVAIIAVSLAVRRRRRIY